MPRFGIKLQIALLCLVLLSILPLIGLNYWGDIRNTTLTAQARIQEIEAKAIATTLLATQQNIRDLLIADEDSELQKHALSAPSIKQAIRMDGLFGDWPLQTNAPPRFNLNHPLWQAIPNEPSETAFSLRLAQSSQHLYVAIDVRDNNVVLRKPSHLRLDYNDHIQFTYHDNTGTLRRVILPAEKEGALASYYTDMNWQFGRDIQPYARTYQAKQNIASHKTGIQGYWRKTTEGYALEFRLPISQLDTVESQVHFAIVDVDDNPAFGPQTIVASLPKALEDKLNPVALHARELQRVIDQLKSTYARLWIYDSRGREWAFAERDPHTEAAPNAFDSQCVQDALQGEINPLHSMKDTDGNHKRLLACYPIIENDVTLGVVVIDESTHHVLEQEEARVKSIAIKVGSTLCFLLLILLFYAVALARRIARLSEESSQSIDLHGRIERTTINASRHFPDEIGDLSRNITNLLEKQHAYMNFLERIPQTLRHEISNPLNKLRTSLENLLDHQPALANDRYIHKIDKGIDQISGITTELTEAASLESAIKEEVLNSMNLIEFLDDYVSIWGSQIDCAPWDKIPALILGDASRLEQLLDKLIDNAISFCHPEGQVSVSIERAAHQIKVIIENDGPLLSTENTSGLFSPMVSTRSSGSSIHLGLGLHIAKLISDQHNAVLVGKNREDGTGVIFSIEFDLI